MEAGASEPSLSQFPQKLFDLTGDLSELTGCDEQFRQPAGRGVEFAQGGGGPDSRDRQKPVDLPRDMLVRDIHLDMLKVKVQNF